MGGKPADWCQAPRAPKPWHDSLHLCGFQFPYSPNGRTEPERPAQRCQLTVPESPASMAQGPGLSDLLQAENQNWEDRTLWRGAPWEKEPITAARNASSELQGFRLRPEAFSSTSPQRPPASSLLLFLSFLLIQNLPPFFFPKGNQNTKLFFKWSTQAPPVLKILQNSNAY